MYHASLQRHLVKSRLWISHRDCFHMGTRLPKGMIQLPAPSLVYLHTRSSPTNWQRNVIDFLKPHTTSGLHVGGTLKVRNIWCGDEWWAAVTGMEFPNCSSVAMTCREPQFPIRNPSSPISLRYLYFLVLLCDTVLSNPYSTVRYSFLYYTLLLSQYHARVP